MKARCTQCGRPIPKDRVDAGRLVSSPAKYCGPSCKSDAHNARTAASRKAARTTTKETEHG